MDAELEQLRYQNAYLVKVYDAAKSLIKAKEGLNAVEAYKQLEAAMAEIDAGEQPRPRFNIFGCPI